MKQSRFTEEQIIGILREQQTGIGGGAVPQARGQLADVLPVKGQFGGMEVSEVRKLKALEQENGRAEAALGRRHAGQRGVEGPAGKKW